MKTEEKKLLILGVKTVLAEAAALKTMAGSLSKDFVSALNTLNSCRGKIIFCGVGKSGLIARKIAATFASIGLDSIYLHPVEAMHGDMGPANSRDVCVALSNSGSTPELNSFLSHLKARKVAVIALTSNPRSRTASICDIHIDIKVKEEACPHNLVPTSSTTAMLALGDAMAVCLMEMKGFKKEIFASHHPGGKLGKILNVKVKTIMRTGPQNPSIGPNATISQACEKMTFSSLGAVSIVDSKGKLKGFFTDGDLRRKFGAISPDDKIKEHMTLNPLSISPEQTAAEAAAIMEKRRIDNLPVIDSQGKLIGVIDERDLIREGIL